MSRLVSSSPSSVDALVGPVQVELLEQGVDPLLVGLVDEQLAVLGPLGEDALTVERSLQLPQLVSRPVGQLVGDPVGVLLEARAGGGDDLVEQLLDLLALGGGDDELARLPAVLELGALQQRPHDVERVRRPADEVEDPLVASGRPPVDEPVGPSPEVADGSDVVGSSPSLMLCRSA